jgi:hypothetical protein
MSTNARAIDVAAAAVTLLNSGPAQASFGSFAPFTAVRDYVPLYDLTQHKAGLIVTVIPAALNESPLARLTINSQVLIDVGVQDVVKTLADKDALMLLVEQIKTVMEKGLTLPEAAVDCGWEGTENEPLYSQEHMLRHSLFTSVPRFAYLTRRAR